MAETNFITVKLANRKTSIKMEKGCSFENNGAIYRINDEGSLNIFDKAKQTLERLNGINSIMPGQMLVVPQISSSTHFDTYIIEKGDNLYNIAKKYSTDLETLQHLNGLEADDYIYPGQKIMIPKKNTGMYIVNEDETLNSVSKKLFFRKNLVIFLANSKYFSSMFS